MLSTVDPSTATAADIERWITQIATEIGLGSRVGPSPSGVIHIHAMPQTQHSVCTISVTGYESHSVVVRHFAFFRDNVVVMQPSPVAGKGKQLTWKDALEQLFLFAISYLEFSESLAPECAGRARERISAPPGTIMI